MITASELRQKYLDFFQSKDHKAIPSAPVVPENDPTALFTTAGMHPLVPYLLGENHPNGRRIVSVQKCIRTVDIDEVGDDTHFTFFEMLGNWSLGDYFKEEAIEMSWEFLTDERWLGLDKNLLAVSVFAGDEDAVFDEASFEIWKNLGVPENRIAKLGKDDNWWGPAGETGPCGPDTEMFYWKGNPDEVPESFDSEDKRWVEIWNDVFMEYNKQADGKFSKLSQRNVDTGMGMERVLAVLNGKANAYETELFEPLIKKIEEISGRSYADDENKRPMRIVADHIKAATFIIADGVEPSNTGRGYVLRRLIRRAVRQGQMLGVKNNFTAEIAKAVQDIYKNVYGEICKEGVLESLNIEEEKFRKTLEKGLKEFESQISKIKSQISNLNLKIISGEVAFNLYQTYGFPLELIIEEAKRDDFQVDTEDFDKKLKEHQELSRTASAGMFKGGLADTKEQTTQLHTVAHLMLAGLRKVLGEHVHQKGSNINGERLRFDFAHPDKMTDEQKKQVEEFVNEAIEKKIDVKMEELPIEEARKQGAEGVFENKYSDVVKVYAIEGYSKEICGGPHVKNTGDIKGKFRIKKEQSSSAGVRRIKAVLEEQ